jgi:hypothetical protein
MSYFKFQMFSSLSHGFDEAAKKPGSGAGELDELKRMLIETNPWFLGVTALVSVLHMVCVAFSPRPSSASLCLAYLASRYLRSSRTSHIGARNANSSECLLGKNSVILSSVNLIVALGDRTVRRMCMHFSSGTDVDFIARSSPMLLSSLLSCST